MQSSAFRDLQSNTLPSPERAQAAAQAVADSPATSLSPLPPAARPLPRGFLPAPTPSAPALCLFSLEPPLCIRLPFAPPPFPDPSLSLSPTYSLPRSLARSLHSHDPHTLPSPLHLRPPLNRPLLTVGGPSKGRPQTVCPPHPTIARARSVGHARVRCTGPARRGPAGWCPARARQGPACRRRAGGPAAARRRPNSLPGLLVEAGAEVAAAVLPAGPRPAAV